MNTKINEYQSIRYLRKSDLIEANRAAIREKRNRQLYPEFVNKLPEDSLFEVLRHDLHNGNEVRLTIRIDDNNPYVFLDISPLRFITLPTAKKYKDGTVQLETEEEIESRRLYPNNREFQQKVTRKPVRNHQFRKIVLEAYDSHCAVCDVCNPRLLRAAHIVPVTKSGEDVIDNGICLCVNHETAFDRGLVIITPNFDIVVNTDVFVGITYLKLRLPTKKENYPSFTNLSRKLEILKISPTLLSSKNDRTI